MWLNDIEDIHVGQPLPLPHNFLGGVSFESHSVAQPSLGLRMQPKLILDSQRSSCLNFGITGMSHRVLTETNSLLVPATSTFLLSLWLTPIGIS